jgi:hypothetical protein
MLLTMSLAKRKSQAPEIPLVRASALPLCACFREHTPSPGSVTRPRNPPPRMISSSPRRRRSEIYDHDASMLIFFSLGLFGRLIDVERQLDSRLLGVRLPPLGFLASANLLDDERG